MPRRKSSLRRQSTGQRLSQPERYLLEIVVILVALAVLVNSAANPTCIGGCNADFWGVAIINGVLATCMLFTLSVLLHTRRGKRRS